MKTAILSTGFTLLVNPVSDFFVEWNPTLQGISHIIVIIGAIFTTYQWAKVAKSYKS